MEFAFKIRRNIFNFKLYHNCYRNHWRYRDVKQCADVKYLLVVDFEATCDEKYNHRQMTQEIIEFPCLKVNALSMKVEARFHEYVKPIVNPQLTTFCVELTGILQEMVDAADPFPDVLRRFEIWRYNHGITGNNSAYVTSGDWDFGRMLPAQCSIAGVTVPQHMEAWVDLKKYYGRVTGNVPKSLIEIIRNCGLKFQGRQHSGIDDCINIANVLRKLGSGDFSPTSRLLSTPSGFRVVNDPI